MFVCRQVNNEAKHALFNREGSLSERVKACASLTQQLSFAWRGLTIGYSSEVRRGGVCIEPWTGMRGIAAKLIFDLVSFILQTCPSFVEVALSFAFAFSFPFHN